MSEWQPIETAPKDGATILLYFPKGYWADDRDIAIGFWSDGDWYSGEADSTPMTGFGSFPSHWMPLPEPPTQS